MAAALGHGQPAPKRARRMSGKAASSAIEKMQEVLHQELLEKQIEEVVKLLRADLRMVPPCLAFVRAGGLLGARGVFPRGVRTEPVSICDVALCCCWFLPNSSVILSRLPLGC